MFLALLWHSNMELLLLMIMHSCLPKLCILICHLSTSLFARIIHSYLPKYYILNCHFICIVNCRSQLLLGVVHYAGTVAMFAFSRSLFRRPAIAASPMLQLYCHFKNSSSVIPLFNTTPAILPVDIAYDTARKGMVLSPQANILSTVVF